MPTEFITLAKVGASIRWLTYMGWAGVLGLVVFATYYYQAEQHRLSVQSSIQCDPLAGCRWPAGTEVVALKFGQSASATTPFIVTVQATPKQSVSLRFDMVGMAMGPAAYQLQETTIPGTYSAKVILPACIQGRSDWRGALQIGNTLRVFKFSVKM